MKKETLKSKELLNHFLDFAEQFIRTPEGHPNLAYYGTGESAHWAVQSSMNLCAALAISGTDGKNPKHLKTALKLFRYAMRTHITGDITATDGAKWGRHWISVLGAERMTHGINALEKHMTKDDLERYRIFRICESDFLLNEYPVVASMRACELKNKPESNLWNGGFLHRTALDYPDEANAAKWKEKGTSLLLNAISHPMDAASEKIFAGKPLREWHVGFNFTPNYSLDHHGYMNVGYSIITLSNLAMLHFNFKERNQKAPEELYHHAEDLWNVVRHFFFSDGRLLRIGGDSRSRYTYCQCYVIPVLLFAADYLRDAEALELEKRLLSLMEKEQLFNSDGSFYGKRLIDIRNESYYYYCRLESDPAVVLSQDMHWRTKKLLSEPGSGKIVSSGIEWHDEYHGAALLKNDSAIRSFVRIGENGPIALCVPPERSDMAEWSQNFFTRAGLRKAAHHEVEHSEIFGKNFFLVSGAILYDEAAPRGEGEKQYSVIRSDYALCALPDGLTTIVMERASILKETTLRSVETLNFEMPNDVYNHCVRHYKGSGFSRKFTTLPAHDEVIDTGSKVLCVDDCLTIFALAGINSLKIHRAEKRSASIFGTPEMTSLYIDRICGNVDPSFRHCLPGEVLCDSTFAVSVGAPLNFAENAHAFSENSLRIVEITGRDGVCYRIFANFGTESVLRNGFEVHPGKALLLRQCGKNFEELR